MAVRAIFKRAYKELPCTQFVGLLLFLGLPAFGRNTQKLKEMYGACFTFTATCNDTVVTLIDDSDKFLSEIFPTRRVIERVKDFTCSGIHAVVKKSVAEWREKKLKKPATVSAVSENAAQSALPATLSNMWQTHALKSYADVGAQTVSLVVASDGDESTTKTVETKTAWYVEMLTTVAGNFVKTCVVDRYSSSATIVDVGKLSPHFSMAVVNNNTEENAFVRSADFVMNDTTADIFLISSTGTIVGFIMMEQKAKSLQLQLSYPHSAPIKMAINVCTTVGKQLHEDCFFVGTDCWKQHNGGNVAEYCLNIHIDRPMDLVHLLATQYVD
jgi:hypothetical protein